MLSRGDLCQHKPPHSYGSPRLPLEDNSNLYNWDKRIGVGLWDIIQEIIGDENLNLMPKIILELIQRKSNEFNYTMKEIFAKTKKGKQIVNNIIDEIKLGTEFENIENDITYNNNEEYFSPEELII